MYRGVALVAKVSRQWFDEFVVTTRGELTGYLGRLLKSSDDALEVSQEAYLKVFVALRKNSEREHTPKALLYATARNVAISRLRHQKIVENTAGAVYINQELQVVERSPEQQACKSDDLQSLLQVINKLPPKCRKVLLLRMLEGLSQKQIASRLGIAVSTVEKHLAKGLRDSRDAMRELERSQTGPARAVVKAVR